jgi:pantoate--beta-alanine ligase
MTIIDSIERMSAFSDEARAKSLSIGFVPTMGALHEGHLSLARRSCSENDRTVVSIFVNPLQFGPREDLDRYPRDMEGDLAKLSSIRTDAVFAPAMEAMYNERFETHVIQENLSMMLCGVSRPTHFRGVLTVVLKLLNIVRPHRAYFGQKDYQQTVAIRRMARDLNIPVNIVVLPTVRERDGLAMSSRNRYLSDSERRDAVCLYRALTAGSELVRRGERSARVVVQKMRGVVENAPSARVDYLAAVDPDSLESREEISLPVALVGAVYVGATRLIDNVTVEE